VQRRREIASSPQRSAGEAWQVITELVTATLERSTSIDRSTVGVTLEAVGGVGRMLIAGGHLESKPIVVVAGPLWLEIVTVSGDRALAIEENLNPVPGAATADNWKMYLPAEGSLAKLVKDAVKDDDHLSADEPVVSTTSKAHQSDGVLNEEALANWAEEKS
jgi:hypothetical protein